MGIKTRYYSGIEVCCKMWIKNRVYFGLKCGVKDKNAKCRV